MVDLGLMDQTERPVSVAAGKLCKQGAIGRGESMLLGPGRNTHVRRKWRGSNEQGEGTDLFAQMSGIQIRPDLRLLESESLGLCVLVARQIPHSFNQTQHRIADIKETERSLDEGDVFLQLHFPLIQEKDFIHRQVCRYE